MARTRQKVGDQVLLQALACGGTVQNAACKAGVSERTAYRRLADPEFCKQLQQLRLEMVQRTAAMLTGAGMSSVKTLVDLQQDVAAPPGVRRRAARDVLEMGMKLRENADWEARLVGLEEQIKTRIKSNRQST